MINLLKEYISNVILEFKNLGEVDLPDGSTTKYGSKEHINDIQSNIDNMTRLRNRHKKGSAARENYSRVIARLKNELKKAIKHSIGNNHDSTK